MATAQPLAPPRDLFAGRIAAARALPWSSVPYRVVCVEAGAVLVTLDSAARRVRSGELAVAGSGSFRADPVDPDTRGWALGFGVDAVHPGAGRRPHRAPLAGDARWLAFVQASDPARGALPVPQAVRPVLASLAARLERELDDRQPGHAEAARALLNLVLVRITRLVAEDTGLSVTFDPAAIELLAVIDARFSEQLSLDELAAAVGRSPRQVSRIAHEQTGISASGLIERRRMQEARRRLRETDEPVNAIASAVGYADPGYFRRRFRRAFGTSPASWRSDVGAG
jgi:AraC family transcriptional activator of pobA